MYFQLKKGRGQKNYREDILSTAFQVNADLDQEGQAKYIIKLSQAELQRQLEDENGGDPDINNELFGADQDDRRNKIVTNNVRTQPAQVAPKESIFTFTFENFSIIWQIFV